MLTIYIARYLHTDVHADWQ